MSNGFVESRWLRLVLAMLVAALLAAAGIALWSLPAKALPCDPTRQDCPEGGGTSTIRATLTVTNNNLNRGTITSSDDGINCGADCSQLYTYIVTCDAEGNCTDPDYRTVSLNTTATNGFALSGWGGACSGSGSCSVTMDTNKTVSASFADVQDPTVSLTSPNADAIVRGTMNISASASDNAGVSQVNFSYGGSFVNSDTSLPYGITVNSATKPDGRRTVAAQAFDTSGRQSVIATRTVIVDNQAPTVVDTTAGLEPDRGMKNVLRNTNVSATFSEEMSPGTLTSSSVKLQAFNSKKKKWMTVPTVISFSDLNTKVTLDPYGTADKSLGANKKHRVIISTGAQDIANHAMTSGFSWTFKTGSATG